MRICYSALNTCRRSVISTLFSVKSRKSIHFLSRSLDVDTVNIKRQGSPLMGVIGSTLKMAPTSNFHSDTSQAIDKFVKDNPVMIFSKSSCPFCKRIKAMLKSKHVSFHAVELDLIENGQEMQMALTSKTGLKTVPNVFVRGSYIGGHDDTVNSYEGGNFMELLNPTQSEYEYDLIVIGGGSGGLAASKQAVFYKKKVAVFDFVDPTPSGTKWGLGGTCVNVGCIPKKLMHQAAILGHSIKDSKAFGWEISNSVKHRWDVMKDSIQDHISSLNWGYRVQLREKDVKYLNAKAEFVEPHKIKAVDKKGKETFLTAKNFILATGERPRYSNISGAKEYCITSDDLFSLPYCPGKTLVVGASYVALECAGFLAGLGLDVTVMVRSILLRGFDQDMAERIGVYMAKENIRFVRPCVPTNIEQIEKGSPGKLKVTGKMESGEKFEDVFNTVLLAIGRDPSTSNIGLDVAGVVTNKSGTIQSINEQTNVPHIYAVGDILEDKPKLTPVAIRAGKLLAKRLYGGSKEQIDYSNVPTTVFTPLEYGCIGYSEESAIDKFGKDDIEIYHTIFQPLEFTVPKRTGEDCYLKLICNKAENERVIGFHYLGPNAGEVTQAYAVAMRLGATKADFDSTIGIHPTTSELFTTITVRKGSGEEVKKTGC